MESKVVMQTDLFSNLVESKITNASIGAICGSTAGAAMQGRIAPGSISLYDPIPVRMAASPTLDAWIVASRAIRREIPAPLLAGQYKSHWNHWTGATGFGLANLGRGVPPPLSGKLDNPEFESASALGRAAFWGLAHLGHPNQAAEAAFWDASLDHASNGVWNAVAVAWFIANLDQPRTTAEIFESTVSLLPASSELAKIAPTLRTWWGKKDAVIHGGKVISDHFVSASTQTVAEALLAISSSDEFGKGIGRAVCGAGDREQAGLVAGVIEGVLFPEIAKEWVSPLESNFVAGHELSGIDAPHLLTDFSVMVVGSVEQLHPAPVTEEPAVIEPLLEVAPTEGEEATSEPTAIIEPIPSIPSIPSPSESLLSHLSAGGDTCLALLDEIEVGVTFIDQVKVAPGRPINLMVAFRSQSDTEAIVEPKIEVPDRWDLATRLTDFRALPGTTTKFPAVIRPPEDWALANTGFSVHLNETEVIVPLLPEDDWAIAGAFANYDGAGFEQIYGPERAQEPGQAFADRNNHGIRWTRWHGDDFEQIFQGQLGVAYLCTELWFGAPTFLTVMCGVKGGVKLWLDGHLVVKCNDSRGPLGDRPSSFVGTYAAGKSAKCVIKVVRGNQPVGPLHLAFRDDQGRVVFPIVRQTLL